MHRCLPNKNINNMFGLSFTWLQLTLSFAGVQYALPLKEGHSCPGYLRSLLASPWVHLRGRLQMRPILQLLWHSFQMRKRAESCRAHSLHGLLAHSVGGRWQGLPRFITGLDFAFLLSEYSFHLSSRAAIFNQCASRLFKSYNT